MNAFDTVTAAVTEVRAMQIAVDRHADSMGRLLMHRLRASDMSGTVLRAFKEELRDYNIHTNRWRR